MSDVFNPVSQYIGESLRTLYVRRKQHIADFKYCSKKRNNNSTITEEGRSSFMWDHVQEVHGGEEDMDPENFRFSVISSFKDPLTRQLTEAVKIKRALDSGSFQSQGGDIIQVHSMNRKAEYFAPLERRQGPE